MEEWPHWQDHALPPPTEAESTVAAAEVEIPVAVNAIICAMKGLNDAAGDWMGVLGKVAAHPWTGSAESLAVRRLKDVYPIAAPEDKFLERMTYLSTLVVDGLQPAVLRDCLSAIGPHLHESRQGKDWKPLGGRKLLERLCLQPG